MSINQFQDYQNELRQMLWREEFREEMLDTSATPIVPLTRTMHLTYPQILEEEVHLMVEVESNG